MTQTQKKNKKNELAREHSAHYYLSSFLPPKQCRHPLALHLPPRARQAAAAAQIAMLANRPLGPFFLHCAGYAWQ